MAMKTRFQTKRKEENNEPLKLKLVESKFVPKIGMVDDKRKAFGEIHNRREVAASTDNNKLGIEKKNSAPIVYKDIKPRVDTRWKKAETAAAVVQKPILSKANSTSTIAATKAALARPVSRQSSKCSDVANLKLEKTVKSITETITMQLKKTTTLASAIDLKKENKPKNQIEAPFIRSPQSMKIKRVEEVGRKFYESHSTHLLHQVENIDEHDKNNPQLLSEYVNDIYAYLMRLENIFPIRDKFLETQMDVTPKMRSVLLDWINEVHNQFNLENETFHMTASMIDRYLQAVTSTPRRFLQLVGVTALFMASKYEELMPPDITDFVYVTDDTYTKEQILQMEMKMFHALNFNLSKPLPIHFLRRFGKAAGTLGDRQYIAAKYFIELAAIDYGLTMYKPSEIAAASLYLSLYIHNNMKNDKDLWTPTLQYYSTYSVQHFMPIVKRLAMIVATAQEAKLKSIFSKYSQPYFKFVATTSEMTGVKIQELIRHA